MVREKRRMKCENIKYLHLVNISTLVIGWPRFFLFNNRQGDQMLLKFPEDVACCKLRFFRRPLFNSPRHAGFRHFISSLKSNAFDLRRYLSYSLSYVDPLPILVIP